MQSTSRDRARGNARGRSQRLKIANVVAVVVACVCIGACILLLVGAFDRLRESIQIERKDYVDEISAQIIGSQRFMRNEYTDQIVTFASVLSAVKPTSLAEVRALLQAKDATSILLVEETGDIIDINGKHVFMSDRSLLFSLHENDGPSQLFSSLNSQQDFWFFTAPVRGLTIGGARYTDIVLTIPADEYADNLAVSLFDSRGASFLIKRDGSIEIEPAAARTPFGGYNLYASLIAHGAPSEGIEALRQDIASGVSDSRLFAISGEEWLVSYSPLDGRTAIVVTVPLTITAEQTYRGLLNTILFASLLVVCVSLLAIAVILRFFRRDQERSRQAMAVAAKSDFFSKMSHDIRTPLNAVIGMEALARESVQDPKAVSEYLDKSTVAANYLLSIINDVLDMSRIESGKMVIAREPFDMPRLLDEITTIVSAMAKERSVHFAVEADEFPSPYLGDAVRIKQVLMNLLSNAVKFTSAEGHVRLRASRSAERGDGDTVVFTVSDDGVGMSEDYMTRIFTPFEQERSSKTQQNAGSGLGLAIVDNLVRMMGGDIDVESRLGIGSTFVVTLPLMVSDTPAPQKPEYKLDVERLKGKRALVAEDNDVNQLVVSRILSGRFAMLSDIASDGRQAVEMFRDSEQYLYDCILMDIQMPVMDGLEAAKRIRALPRADAITVPIIALSANALEEDVASSIAVGMFGHLSKPINVVALGEMLDRALNERSDESA